MTARSNRPDPPTPRPLSNWTILAGALVVLGVAAVIGFVMLRRYGGQGAQIQLDVIRTAGTLVIGTGGAVALLLTARRQRYIELALVHTDRDATERRITELYTKAADQLGSEKAPVRLAGLHALERLAQSTLDQRQTIVDVICAYLRMPYTPPDDQPPAEDASAEAHTRYENRSQELQVRLTAQRILAAHLRPDVGDTFWHDTDLDLTEAYLHGLDLAGCHVESAHFDGAQFSGDTGFGGARFDKDAVFNRVRFDKNARFGEAQFSGNANFYGARFCDDADFDEARFGGDADFNSAQFKTGNFCGTQFDGPAEFNQAQFDWGYFRRARFYGRYTVFGSARFGGDAGFDGAKFSGETSFDSTWFGKDAVFSEARFSGPTFFYGTLFDGDARFGEAQFDRNADFDKAKFGWQAIFNKARFGGDADFMEAQFNAAADFIEAQFDAEDANFQGARARPRHHSWPTGWTTRDARTAEGEEEGWVYLVRVESDGEQQPDREDRSGSEAGTSGT